MRVVVEMLWRWWRVRGEWGDGGRWWLQGDAGLGVAVRMVGGGSVAGMEKGDSRCGRW